MVLHRLASLRDNPHPLQLHLNFSDPRPGPSELLIRVSVCGVCHTEIDEIEGRTPPPRLPVIPGHQAVGCIMETGAGVSGFSSGERVGVGWIHAACGACDRCRNGEENLCSSFVATGRDRHGGYAELLTVPAAFAHRIPPTIPDAAAAPLLCAGAIGYRSVKLSRLRDGQRLGLTGFGASAHLILKMIHHLHPSATVCVFARSPAERQFALQLGAAWAGDIGQTPPNSLDCIIDTTPVWRPVTESLRFLAPGGRLVINAIRKESHDRAALAEIEYERDLWMEREVKSVANVTREDIREFLAIASAMALVPDVEEFALDDANTALRELKEQKIRGGKVLRIGDDVRQG